MTGLLPGGSLASTAVRTAAPPVAAHMALPLPVGVTGVWAFETNDTPDNLVHFTLYLRQRGTQVVGFDTGREPVRGYMTGRTLSFTVYGVSSEDDYGGQGTLDSIGRLLSGSFWDGYGFTGDFIAARVTGALSSTATSVTRPFAEQALVTGQSRDRPAPR